VSRHRETSRRRSARTRGSPSAISPFSTSSEPISYEHACDVSEAAREHQPAPSADAGLRRWRARRNRANNSSSHRSSTTSRARLRLAQRPLRPRCRPARPLPEPCSVQTAVRARANDARRQDIPAARDRMKENLASGMSTFGVRAPAEVRSCCLPPSVAQWWPANTHATRRVKQGVTGRSRGERRPDVAGQAFAVSVSELTQPSTYTRSLVWPERARIVVARKRPWSRSCQAARCDRRKLRGADWRPKGQNPAVAGALGVELGGLEPPTSWVRSRRSPN
jgi:hypothetical protein